VLPVGLHEIVPVRRYQWEWYIRLAYAAQVDDLLSLFNQGRVDPGLTGGDVVAHDHHDRVAGLELASELENIGSLQLLPFEVTLGAPGLDHAFASHLRQEGRSLRFQFQREIVLNQLETDHGDHPSVQDDLIGAVLAGHLVQENVPGS